jgi:glycosyltransferase involved in cell wall biosynthesis
MKIGIFTNNYLPNPYGVPGSVETFRKEFEKMGHKVFVFAPDWPGYKDGNKNVFRYPSLDIKIKFRFPLAIPYSKKMDAILENLDLDIIHSQHPNLLGAAAEKWARKKNIPLVFTWHTLYDKYSHFVPFLPKKLVNYWTIRNARNYANLADKVIAPTDSIIPILRKWKVKNDIIAIPTGVEEEIFSDKNREKSRRNFGFEEKNIVILLVSRLTEEKNVGFVFKSLAKILKSDSRIKFLVVGGGYLFDNIINWTRLKKLTGQIIFVGEKKTDRNCGVLCGGGYFCVCFSVGNARHDCD